MRRLFLVILVVTLALTSLSAEARRYSRSHSGFSKGASIFSQKAVKKKLIAKSVFNPRPKFRKATTDGAIKNAKKNPDGTMVCPTCDRRITGEKVNGRRDFDLDHHPTTWSDRKKQMEEKNPPRRVVIDEYQKDVRVQCPDCNRSHKFEGKSSKE